MFVYRNNTLEKFVEYIDDKKSKVGIYHVPTKMALSFTIYSDPSLPLNQPNVFKSKSFSDSELSSMISAYEIRGMETDSDKYNFLKDVYNSRKTLVENFLEAIEVFEDEIYNRLKEQKPQATPPTTPPPPQNPKDDQKPKTKSELPNVGDIVEVDGKFGFVTDVKGESREIKISQMTRDEAMSRLKVIKTTQEEI